MLPMLILALALPAQSAPAKKAAVKPLVSKEGGFSIVMPGKTKDRKENSAGIKKVAYAIYLDDGTIYEVSFSDYPEDFIDEKADPNVFLQQEQKGNIALHTRATEKRSEAITLEGHPGIEYEYALGAGASGRTSAGKVRIFLIGRRLYRIMVQGPEAKVRGKEADRMFETFKFAPKPKS